VNSKYNYISVLSLALLATAGCVRDRARPVNDRAQGKVAFNDRSELAKRNTLPGIQDRPRAVIAERDRSTPRAAPPATPQITLPRAGESIAAAAADPPETTRDWFNEESATAELSDSVPESFIPPRETAPAVPKVPDPIETPVDPRDIEAVVEHLRSIEVEIGFNSAQQVNLVDAEHKNFTDADALQLEAFPQLAQLNLRDTAISDKGLRGLRRLTELEFVGLSNTPISDRGLAMLAGSRHLRFLSLANTKITDRAVPLLARLGSLRGLNVHNTRMTPSGIVQLRKALPECKIVENAGATTASGRFEDDVERSVAALSANGITGSVVSRTALTSPVTGSPADPNGKDRYVVSQTPYASLPAEERLRNVLASHLHDPKLLEAMGDLRYERAEWDAAAKLYQACLNSQPENNRLRQRLAYALAGSGDMAAAEIELLRALPPADAYYAMAVLYHERGDFADCRTQLKECLQWDRDHAAARALLQTMTREKAEETLQNRPPRAAEDEVLQLLLETIEGSRAKAPPVQAAQPRADHGIAIHPYAATHEVP